MERLTTKQLVDQVMQLPTSEEHEPTDSEKIVKWVPMIDDRLRTLVGREQYSRNGNYTPVRVMLGRREIARLLVSSTVDPEGKNYTGQARMTIDLLEKEITRSLEVILGIIDG